MYKRVVIKIGSGVITKDGRLAEDVVAGLVEQVAALRTRGVEVLIVTSGAVVTGKSILSERGMSESIPDRQALAAVGQIGLMALYAKLFNEQGMHCAQVLVTKGDFRDHQHYINMKNCLENLLQRDIIPIVNENDAIAITELIFTDNDEVAGLIASLLNAEAVVFLTSVDGILEQETGTVITEIHPDAAQSFESHITNVKSATGRGGMHRKFEIAKKLMAQGIAAHIANGAKKDVVEDIIEGRKIGTTFIPDKKASAPKRRLAYAEGLSAGAVYVDNRAEDILLSKKFVSLLPVGVVKVEGQFKKGDTIEIRNESGKKLGFGVAQYDAEKAKELRGRKGGRALIHYDYMFIG